MIPSPIRKALSTIRKHQVDHLLMGGQACVLYGAAEFSRDLDLVLLPNPQNLRCLEPALAELRAEVIAVPPYREEHLEAGLAVHFRCQSPEVRGLRLDIMTRLRGVDTFDQLWPRRTTLELGDEVLEVLALPDLVAAKKTQRDKDWPMIRRLVEVNYLTCEDPPSPERLSFWLLELRTPEILLEVAEQWPDAARSLVGQRSLLELATPGALASGELGQALREEEEAERHADRVYWQPLRKKLADLRHEHQRSRRKTR